MMKCPTCDKQISNLAPECPFCKKMKTATPAESGLPKPAPVATPPLHSDPPPVPTAQPTQVVIEVTGKKWKKIQLVSVLLIMAGMVSCMMSLSGKTSPAIPGLMVLAGFGGYIYGRVGAWWHHG